MSHNFFFINLVSYYLLKHTFTYIRPEYPPDVELCTRSACAGVVQRYTHQHRLAQGMEMKVYLLTEENKNTAICFSSNSMKSN